MRIRWVRFNIYLLAVLGLLAGAGCNSPAAKKKKVLSTVLLHTEMNSDNKGRSERVEVFRAQPFSVTIDKQPFLTDAFVKDARVIEVVGGFALQLQFDQKGSWLLEETSVAMHGRHLAIFSQFVNPGEEHMNTGRWLAAPLFSARITDGLLVFTPDASRAETEQIALGLNNVARKLRTGK
jgi:hypothetical protein